LAGPEVRPSIQVLGARFFPLSFTSEAKGVSFSGARGGGQVAYSLRFCHPAPQNRVRDRREGIWKFGNVSGSGGPLAGSLTKLGGPKKRPHHRAGIRGGTKSKKKKSSPRPGTFFILGGYVQKTGKPCNGETLGVWVRPPQKPFR